MKRTSFRIGVVVAMVGLTLTVGRSVASARTQTIVTPVLQIALDPDGYVNCEVEATSTAPVGIVATVMSTSDTNVTDFGTSFRASAAASGDGLYHAEETAGSLSDDASYCKVTVTSTRKRNVSVTLTSYHADQTAIETVTAP